MHAQTPKKPKKKPTTLSKLIKIESDILKDLKKMLRDPTLSTEEKLRIANAIGYHACILNKLQSQKGEQPPFNESTLGDYIKDVNDQTVILRRIRRDFKVWTRKLSLKK